MKCPNCEMADLKFIEVACTLSVFDTKEDGSKAERIDDIKTGITFCSCEYCKAIFPVDYVTSLPDCDETLDSERILDELGIEV